MITLKEVQAILDDFALMKIEGIHLIPEFEEHCSDTLVDIVEEGNYNIPTDVFTMTEEAFDAKHGCDVLAALTEEKAGELLVFISSPVFQGDSLTWGFTSNLVVCASSIPEAVAKGVKLIESVRKLDNPSWEGNYQDYIKRLN